MVAPGIVSQLKQPSQHRFYALQRVSQHLIPSDGFPAPHPNELIKSLGESVKTLVLTASRSKQFTEELQFIGRNTPSFPPLPPLILFDTQINHNTRDSK